MFKKGWFGNWIVGFILVGCSQPPVVKDIEKPTLPIKVAIIDSGVDLIHSAGVHFCLKGHYDYVKKVAEIGDDMTQDLHGTKMARIIAQKSKGNYCFIIYKVINTGKDGDADDIADAINRATLNGAQVINLSISNKNAKSFSQKELASLKAAAAKGIRIFVAAGNNDSDLDKNCDVYPACYKGIRMTVVGSRKTPIPKNISNYGSIINRFEKFCYDDICGTSVATAIASGKTVRELNIR